MPRETPTSMRVETQQFCQATLRALVRAERDGRVPARFTGTGKDVWSTFRNELTAADLVALCVQDAGATMPIPFDPSLWWPDWPDPARLRPSVTEAERWIDEALAQAGQPRDVYLRGQAALLGIRIPSDEGMFALPTPQRHEHWLELPGTGGWLAYTLVSRPDADLYFWENYTIACGTPQEMLLAGLIAWELGAPPRMDLPIQLDDPDLTATLKAGETYHAIVGRRELHGHHNLRNLRTTPLVWEAIQQVVLPHAEANAQPLAKNENAEIPQAEWDALRKRRLRQYTDTTLSRTRQHITAHLIKFGLLEARSISGARIAKHIFAHFRGHFRDVRHRPWHGLLLPGLSRRHHPR